VSQRAVEVLVKWHGLAHESLDVVEGHTLVEESGRVRLPHELKELSDGSVVRSLFSSLFRRFFSRLFRRLFWRLLSCQRQLCHKVLNSGFNDWQGQRVIHIDLILDLNKVKLLEEQGFGILISHYEVKQSYTI
jgi:hypothetical protein